MNDNPLLKLHDFGQSIWLDFLSRGMLESGELQRYITDDGLRGVTSNPTIFHKAITEGQDYDDAVREMALKGKSPAAIFQTLSIADVQRAADLFRPLFDRLEGADGFVSLEVNPRLANDTAGTIEEARRFWAALDRPNVFIKVPGTREGLPAITELIGDGINVNVTLLFGLPRYQEVANAYIAGLEKRTAQGRPIDHVSSVASFFLSRIDALVDPALQKLIGEGGKGSGIAAPAKGKVAIASAKVAYKMYKEIFASERFQKLAEHGARKQRVLWASTSTKNKEYSDVMYVEALIGADTINTVPVETLHAYRDHGQPAARLEEGLAEAEQALLNLPAVNVDLAGVTQQLELEGVRKFSDSLDKLLEAIKQKSAAAGLRSFSVGADRAA